MIYIDKICIHTHAFVCSKTKLPGIVSIVPLFVHVHVHTTWYLSMSPCISPYLHLHLYLCLLTLTLSDYLKSFRIKFGLTLKSCHLVFSLIESGLYPKWVAEIFLDAHAFANKGLCTENLCPLQLPLFYLQL